MNKRKTKHIKPHLLLILIILLALCTTTATAITIPADTSVGTWNPDTRIYTLTTDVSAPIVVGESNLTLNGDGHTISGTGTGSGIQIWGSKPYNIIWKTDVTVENCNITGFYNGISTKFCLTLTIQNNTITGCPRGFSFGDETNNSTITGNSISQSNTDGIYLNDSKNNVFTDNTISNSNRGFYIYDYSNNNLIYHNNLICNATQAEIIISSGNIFNLDFPTGGNHWSDWGGPDEDGDGFVDLPYVISGGQQDNLPFVNDSGWANQAPVVDAGEDQVVIEVGTLVQLDSNSFDADGDPLTYSWSFLQKPEGSTAALSNPNIADPNFVADVHGDYILELVVSDGTASSSDDVTISFDNVKPVADAGGNLSVVAPNMVPLDGSASYDGNNDLLTYSWLLVAKPEGSAAVISDANSAQTSFNADLPGEYVVSLVVNDGFVDSDPAVISIMAVTNEDMATQTLTQVLEQINILPTDNFKNKNLTKPLTNKINSALAMIDTGFYIDAINKLTNDILAKTNGCAESGSPDKNDWITTCEGQAAVYPLIIDTIQYLENIIQ